MNERGQSLRLRHRLRDARAVFSACTSSACPGPVRQDCVDRAVEIAQVTPSFVFDVVDAAGQIARPVQLFVDGELVAESVGAEPIAADPGIHRFRFVAAHRPPVEHTIVVQEGQVEQRVVVTVGDVEQSARPVSHQRITGEALTGIGTAGLVVGGILGLLAKTHYDDALSQQCRGNAHTCNPLGASQIDGAHEEATASTAVFVAGAAAVIGGVAVWATAPAVVHVSPSIGGVTFALECAF